MLTMLLDSDRNTVHMSMCEFIEQTLYIRLLPVYQSKYCSFL